MSTHLTKDCPGCGKALRVRPEYLGLVVVCKNCERPLKVGREASLTVVEQFDRSTATTAELGKRFSATLAEKHQVEIRLGKALAERDHLQEQHTAILASRDQLSDELEASRTEHSNQRRFAAALEARVAELLERLETSEQETDRLRQSIDDFSKIELRFEELSNELARTRWERDEVEARAVELAQKAEELSLRLGFRRGPKRPVQPEPYSAQRKTRIARASPQGIVVGIQNAR